jgi:hypothetical protein
MTRRLARKRRHPQSDKEAGARQLSPCAMDTSAPDGSDADNVLKSQRKFSKSPALSVGVLGPSFTWEPSD